MSDAGAGPGAIVLVTTSFPIRGDGSEAAGSFVSDLAEELATRVPVRVVAPGTSSGREQWSNGVEVFRFAAPDRPLSTLRPWRPADLVAMPRLMGAGLASTREAVRTTAVSHIVALWALPSGHWARVVSRESGVPYSVWTLGSDIWSLGKLPLVRTWLHRVLSQASRCFSDGMQLATDTRSIARRDVEFLPSTRKTHRVREADPRSAAPYRLVFIGRWHPNKGVDLLLEALALLDDDDWLRIERVDVCGGGPLETLVRAGVEGLQSSGRPVTLHGYLDQSAAEEAIGQADYLLIPSRIESIPVVFSDAMKLHCPVVSMPVGDLATLVTRTPECGLVAGEVTARGFAAAISQALATSAAERVPGTEVRASQFDLATIASRLIASGGTGDV